MKGLEESNKMRSAQELEDALHDLAQPLTALAFLTEMALLQRDPKTWRDALESSAVETRRAMAQLRRARASTGGDTTPLGGK